MTARMAGADGLPEIPPAAEPEASGEGPKVAGVARRIGLAMQIA